MRSSESPLSIRELILFGILGALTFAMKLVMAALPNIEPVSLCVMVYAVVFGYKALYPIYVYVAMEILCFGLGIWNMYYLYIWAILAVTAFFLRDMQQPLGWALVSGVFGLLFGALCGIADAFIGGIPFAVAKWASGIPFDITHCLGNFFIALVMFKPLRELLDRLYKQMRR